VSAVASLVGERYALSLYEIAKDENIAKDMLEELHQVAQVFREYPDYLKLLGTPAIPKTDKHETLSKVFEGRVHPYLLNFLMLITDKSRVGEIFQIEQAYKEQLYLDEGICEVVAITAVPMDDQTAKRLQQKMCTVTGKKVDLVNQVDPAILGGIIVKVENKQIDSSVKNRLSEIADSLTQTIA
jgi:F-type H+-transporting ATPase subunit delta